MSREPVELHYITFIKLTLLSKATFSFHIASTGWAGSFLWWSWASIHGVRRYFTTQLKMFSQWWFDCWKVRRATQSARVILWGPGMFVPHLMIILPVDISVGTKEVDRCANRNKRKLSLHLYSLKEFVWVYLEWKMLWLATFNISLLITHLALFG